MKFSFPSKLKVKNKNNSVLSSPIRPHTDWQRMLIGFFVLAVLVGAWSYYLLWMSNHADYADPFDSSAPVVKKSALEKAEEFFGQREALRASSTKVFVDPSLQD